MGLPRTEPATDHIVIAYLTSLYARATDTFIRDEVSLLRAAGDTVRTFSIRKPPESEVVNDDIARERAGTTYLLDLPRADLLSATVTMLARRPRAVVRAVRVARQLSRPGLRGRLWPWFYLVEACALAVRLQDERVEHLHNHIGEGTASVALLASVLTDIPYSFTVHGPSEWDVPTEISLDVKAAHAAFVATISDYTQGQLRRWVDDADWDKVQVVRCGVQPQERPAPPTPASPATAGGPDEPTQVRLVSVGRLVPEKGHLVLLESLTRLPSLDGVRVVLVGDGPLRPRLTSFVREHGLESVVEFAGWRTTDEVHALLGSATALVMPSFAEGLPVSIMEAYAMGKPVVSSDVGGVAELVEPGTSGWLVPPGSVTALAEALRELLAMSPADRERLGATGRDRVQAQHDLTAEVATLRRLIHASVH